MAKRVVAMTNNVTIRLSDDDLTFLDACKRTTGRNRSHLMRRALGLLRINAEFTDLPNIQPSVQGMNHEDIRRMLGVLKKQPTDNPIVGKTTEIEILVEGKRIRKWGGAYRCLYCDLLVTAGMGMDITACPGCGAAWYDKKEMEQVTCPHCQTDLYIEPDHPPDAILYCVQCSKPISRSEEE